ncbi:autotransporter assembly complex protein TamA [Celerinatantimonas sp. MCCC 1A17872]|uniref:autotransporter assembly complex protein TamA n=1 Tax=Celerinatantimonas sp. MCCC 1A17872 TaxID=3177514 RepID=UPI0038C7070B
MRRLALLLWLISSPVIAGINYQVDGGTQPQRANVEAFLKAQNLSNDNSDEFIIAHSQKQVSEALEALGYFAAQAQIKLERSDDDIQVNVHITPGTPVRITRFDWQLSGQLNDSADFKVLFKNQAPHEGDIFNSGDYDAFKSAVNEYASSHGYFDGHFSQAKVSVTRAKREAVIHLHYDSGVRYRIGKINFSSPDVPTKLLTGLADFSLGAPYDAQKVASFSQSLNQTGYFRSVLVTPKMGKRNNGQVDLNVDLRRKSANIFGVGLGYSTDEGVKGKFKWNHPWVNRWGHQFSASIEASKTDQTLSTEYRIPVTNPVNDYIALQTGYEREIDNDTDSRSHLITLLRQWDWDPQWTPQIFFKTLYEDYRQGQQNDSTLLFMPGFSLSRIRTQGPKADPSWGDTESFMAEVSSPEWFSDVALTKLKAHTKWLRSFGRSRIIARATSGVIIVNHISDVPASMRFFAGGDESIRGYGYKSISPRDSSGDLVGGKYLATGSLEYNYQFADKWRAAVFYDTGTAANNFDERLYAGAGVGLRWLTPIGPVRIDFAKPLVKSEENDHWRIHFSIGSDL